MSLFRDGKNAFCDEADPRHLSPPGLSVHRRAAGACAGLLRRHQPAGEQLQAVGARLRGPPATWPGPPATAPPWSASPRPRGSGTRVELRSPDPACNPYLSLAVCLAAGLDGIERQLTPPEPLSGNLYELGDASGIQRPPRFSGRGHPGAGGGRRHHRRPGRPCDGAVSGRKAPGVPGLRCPGVPVGAGAVSGDILTLLKRAAERRGHSSWTGSYWRLPL